MGYPRISFVKDDRPGFTVELPPGLVIADPADAGPLPTAMSRYTVLFNAARPNAD